MRHIELRENEQTVHSVRFIFFCGMSAEKSQFELDYRAGIYRSIRTMDKRNYDRQVIGLFDTLGCFFVDIFYNDLYLKAKGSVKEGKFGSVTDAYRANILNYMNGIKLRELYTGVVKKLHEYYQRVTGFSSLVFVDFEDKVL